MAFESILDNLNPPQREAVVTTEGPLLILAGAGSGKTRVLTRRIAYILANKLARRNQILAVTFTNKAAKEMKERVEELCGPGRFRDLGTFHSVCARWLRAEAESLGLSPSFAIYATAEQLLVMKEVITSMGLDLKKFTPRSFLSQVSAWKNQMVMPDQAANSARLAFEKDRAKAYALYQKRLRENQALDFDDILVLAVELFRRNPETLKAYQERIRYVLIDEYQDVNPVQYELVRMLAGQRRNLCAVGDDDQSIYAFRGADVSILWRFEKDFPEAKIIKLEQNYRSTKWILQASNQVVAHNSGRKSKALWTAREGGDKLVYYRAGDGRDEARNIARTIKELRSSEARNYGDFVLLYRTNSQSRLLEEGMIQAALPYKIVGGLRFFERKEIKDVLAYLRVLQNPSDSISLRRAMNEPSRGVGNTSMARLVEFAEEQEITLYEALRRVDEVRVPGKARQGLAAMVAWMDELSIEIREGQLPVLDVVERVLTNSGYRKALEDENTVEAQARLENLDELINTVGEFDRNNEEGGLETYLAEVSLLSDQDTYEDAQDTVTLMTLHAAKGLEFPVVFLAGLEEEIFPHIRSIDDPEQMEEERRLCYVGMTRAMDKLFLSSAQSRMLHGMMAPRKASRFLDEIPPETLDTRSLRWEAEEPPAIGSSQWRGWGSSAPAPVKGYSGQAAKNRVGPVSTPTPGPVAAFKEGDRVRHKAFGEGTVKAANKDIVTVAFDKMGEKKLKQDFLQALGDDEPSRARLRIGDRVNHSRWGAGVVKAAERETVTVIFPGLTLNMSHAEACRK
ncbi:MAG: ATP-dependent helicase [Vulcanimicrobiota bacterium]